ncbi:MAG TPA: hypothetical protein VHG30_12595, partial [Microvirga sp.]|nr:hypothetical protein [Microvirga sp.]
MHPRVWHLLLIAALSLAPTPIGRADAEPVPRPVPETADVVEKEGFRFVRKLGPFTRARLLDYSAQHEGLGFSVTYAGPGVGDIYVYHRGQDLRRGGDIAAERDAALNDIGAVAQRGLYEAADILERSATPVPLGGHIAATA